MSFEVRYAGAVDCQTCNISAMRVGNTSNTDDIEVYPIFVQDLYCSMFKPKDSELIHNVRITLVYDRGPHASLTMMVIFMAVRNF